MGFFSKLFGGASSTTSEATRQRVTQARTDIEVRKQQQGDRIRYDGELIDKLKDDHQSLFKLYGDLVAAKDRDDFRTVVHKLHEFKLVLQTHLMVENVRFYVYLQQRFSADADVAGFVADVRKEMDGIARAAVRFVNTYAVPDYTPEMKKNFAEELGAIGNVLTKRVAMEESRLYPLYERA